MTPKEANLAFWTLAKEIGPDAEIYVSLSGGARELALSASVYPSGLTKNSDFNFRIEAAEFEPLLDATRAKWAEHKDLHRKQVIKKIALTIISITRDFGACTEAALRGSGFTARDIAAYGADAVTEANAMADAGPFSIAKAIGANAPAEGVEGRALQ
jgi:hypothetical protein